MRILKLLKEIGKDFVKEFVVPCVIIAISCCGFSFVYKNAPQYIREILYDIVAYGGISILIIILIVSGIKNLINYIKKKWNEVK